MKINNLIAELEAATEGSRELDGEIWLATNHSCVPIGAEIYWMRPGTIGWSVPRDQMLRRSAFDVPHYTTSLDAALTLVPDGWGWTIEWDGIAAVRPPESEGDDELAIWELTPNGTPVLALCIASLKARQVIESNKND